jgi:hypothetical protein
VAVRLFKSAALGPGPEWPRFETIDQADWREELDTLRRANDMVNDDCTLVVLRVSGGPEEPPWPDPVAEQDEAVEVADAGVEAGAIAEVPTAEEGAATATEPEEQEATAAERPEAEATPEEAPAAEDDFAVTESVSDLVIDRPAQDPAADADEPDEPPESTDPGV